MAYVDFTTGTETDPTSKITVTSTRVEWDQIDEGTNARVYKDYGANYFSTSGDITHYFTQYISPDNNASGVSHCSYGLANVNNLANNTSTQKLTCRIYRESASDHRLTNAWWYNASNEGQDVAFCGSTNTIYVTAFYDYSVGSYGSWTIYCYSDSNRTTLVDSATTTLTGGRPPSFQYLYAYAYYGAEIGSYVQDGYIENVDIGEAGSSISTSPSTSISTSPSTSISSSPSVSTSISTSPSTSVSSSPSVSTSISSSPSTSVSSSPSVSTSISSSPSTSVSSSPSVSTSPSTSVSTSPSTSVSTSPSAGGSSISTSPSTSVSSSPSTSVSTSISTSPSAGTPVGLYYWDGASWQPVQTSV